MVASAAVSGFGTLLQAGDGATPTELFTTIAEVRNISALSLTTELIDVTHHTAPGGYREWLPSFKDGGQITADLNFLPGDTSHQSVLADFNNRTRRNYKVIYPNVQASSFVVQAYVSGMTINAPIDDRLSANLTLRTTGEPVWDYSA